MAANVLGIVCYVISGYFVLTVSVLSFVSGQLSWVKWVMSLGFSIPALIALVCGFAFRKFKKKLRDLGIVLLASAATSAFMILSCSLRFFAEEPGARRAGDEPLSRAVVRSARRNMVRCRRWSCKGK